MPPKVRLKDFGVQVRICFKYVEDSSFEALSGQGLSLRQNRPKSNMKNLSAFVFIEENLFEGMTIRAEKGGDVVI